MHSTVFRAGRAPRAVSLLLLAGLAGCTSLQKAAQTGDVAAVVKGLTAGKDVNMVDQHGRPLVSIAAERGQLGVLRELIARQADIGKKDNRGMTPLYIAAGYNQLSVVQELVVAGAEVDSRNTDLEMTPLMPAAEAGYKAVVEYLLAKGAAPGARSRDNQTALSRLARTSATTSQSDNLGTAQLLLAGVRARAGAKGASAYVNQADSRGLTALHGAAARNNPELVEWLLRNGAQPNPGATVAADDLQRVITPEISPFASALDVGGGLLGLLPRLGAGGTAAAATDPSAAPATPPAELTRWTPLHSAALHCGAGEPTVKALLAGGANAAARLDNGRSVLQLLADCAQGDPAPVVKLVLDRARRKAPAAEFRKLLAEEGASGSAALVSAVARGHAETVRLLLAAGASPNAVGKDGRVALHLALEGGSTDTLKHLLAARANPNLADGGGRLPLVMMVEKGDAAAVQLLLQAGARANVVVGGNDTPLHQAVARGHVEIVKALLAAGAEPDAMPGGREPALQLAMTRDLLPVGAALLGKGANPELAVANGVPPLHRAAIEGRPAWARLLIAHKAQLNRLHGKATPLYWSVQKGHLEVARELLAAKANPDIGLDGGSWTALHMAANDGLEQAFQILVAGGANRALRDDQGRSADDLARLRAQRLAAEAAAAREAERERQQNSFQWGKFAAMAAGMAPALGELDSASRADLLMGAVRDSMAGQQGMSNLQSAANDTSRRLGGSGGGTPPAEPFRAAAAPAGTGGGSGGGGAITDGTYMLEGGGMSAEVRMEGGNVILFEPMVNRTSVYRPQGNGSYMTFSEKLNRRFYLRALDGQTLELSSEGNNSPTRMNLMSRSGGDALVVKENEADMAVAERYRALSQSDPVNAQAWTACSAAALKRAVSSATDADAYGRQMASMLQQMDATSSTCPDAIPSQLW